MQRSHLDRPAQESLTNYLIAFCVALGVFLVIYENTGTTDLSLIDLGSAALAIIALKITGRLIKSRLTFLGISTTVMLLLPFLVNRLTRELLGDALPLETVVTCSIRNATLLVFLLPLDRRAQAISVGSSLMVMLAVCLQAFTVTTSVLAFAHCILSMSWLMTWHWSKLDSMAPSDSQRVIPYAAKLSIVGVITTVALIFILFFRDSDTMRAIAGFMPSSGGTGQSDPFAFRGIGNGDQMVKATDSAKSVGPLESDLFIESTMPSLYDVFNDLYQPPAKRTKSMSRAIPLSPNEMQSNHNKLARNEAATREFSAVRQPQDKSKPQATPDDVRSNALFYVQGRVPVHLRHEIFNHWDGETLSFRGHSPRKKLALAEAESKRWAIWATNNEIESKKRERHSIRISKLSTRRFPIPSDAFGINIDKLHTVHLFRFTEDGVLSLAGGEIPSLSVAHSLSLPPERDAIEQAEFIRERGFVDSELNPQLLKLANKWTANANTDWERVEAVIAGIQATCRLDPGASITEAESDVLDRFLLQEKKGPDYCFAIAAARLLTSLGYETRVANGYYADPKNFDRLSRQTAVLPENVHFWAEVKMNDDAWTIVEASPGYLVQYARPTIAQVVSRYAMAVGAFAWSQRYTLAGATLFVVIIACVWQRLYLLVLRTWLQAPLPRTRRRTVRLSLGVLEAHAQLQGTVRAPQATVEDWLQDMTRSKSFDSESSTQRKFRRFLQWALYSKSECPSDAADVHGVCLEFVNRVCRS